MPASNPFGEINSWEIAVMSKLILPAKMQNFESMMKFIEDGAKNQGFDRDKVNQVKIAAEEALVNVISYAYDDSDGNVEINCDGKEGRGLVIEIIDSGTPFDPTSMPEPDIDAPLDDRRIGGLGVYMMHQLMDEVNYRRDGNRNILTIAKC